MKNGFELMKIADAEKQSMFDVCKESIRQKFNEEKEFLVVAGKRKDDELNFKNEELCSKYNEIEAKDAELYDCEVYIKDLEVALSDITMERNELLNSVPDDALLRAVKTYELEAEGHLTEMYDITVMLNSTTSTNNLYEKKIHELKNETLDLHNEVVSSELKCRLDVAKIKKTLRKERYYFI